MLCLSSFFSSPFIISDPHGPPKINCWSDPMSPSQWKEEHVSSDNDMFFLKKSW